MNSLSININETQIIYTKVKQVDNGSSYDSPENSKNANIEYVAKEKALLNKITLRENYNWKQHKEEEVLIERLNSYIWVTRVEPPMP